MSRRGGVIETELGNDGFDDFAGVRKDGNGYRVFVGLRLLQCLELAVEQGRRHEMLGARGDAASDEVAVAF